MILIDANLLLYAEDSLSPHHAAAKAWLDKQLSGADPVGLCWTTLTAFLRITTNQRIMQRPLSLAEASAKVSGWLAQPCVRLVQPTSLHWAILQKIMAEAGVVANLVPDAHLAALAMEHASVLCSADGDFARFSSIRWHNPLKG
ncbi:MAG: type II toxin-antitoxin system VapC family toxin [Verrucomicrobiota bacterium]